MKGHTNNPNGRPKGSPNKITKELRSFVADLLDENREQIIEDFKKISPKERLLILERYMQYVIPKKTHNEETKMRTQTLTFDEFQRLLNGEQID
ncbi:MAG: hypothetical protein K5918_03590 [Bacteroidales bacterium]|nr:hypothetical protein [Bacteroidales bacterium]